MPASAPHLNKETDDTLAGNAAHWLAKMCFDFHQDPSHFLGQTADNGVPIDEEMVEAVRLYVDLVNRYRAELPNSDFQYEQKVYMPQVHDACFGTADAWIYDAASFTLYLIDFKYGHRYVDPFYNMQLILYAVGIINRYKLRCYVNIKFIIVQPRCFSNHGYYETWETKSNVLWPVVEHLAAKAKEVYSDPYMTTGPHCRDCKAIVHCTANRKSTYNLMDYAAHDYETDKMDDYDVGAEYRLIQKALKVIEARRDAIKDEIEHRIDTKPHQATGYKIENGRSKWVWNQDNRMVRTFMSSFGIDVSKDEIDTVAQARKKMPKKLRDQFDEIRPNLAEKVDGAKKLTHIEESKSFIVFGRR